MKYSLELFWLYWLLIGFVLIALLWYLTSRMRIRDARLRLIRALALATFLTPTVLPYSYSLEFIPAIFMLASIFFSNEAQSHLLWWLLFGGLPLLLTSAVFYVSLGLKSRTRN